MSEEKPEKMYVDILGDGEYIEVPVPIGSCGICKYAALQIFVGTHYIHQQRHSICNKCNIANGMEKYEPSVVDWSEITKLTQEHNVVRRDLKELHEKWKSRKDCGW